MAAALQMVTPSTPDDGSVKVKVAGPRRAQILRDIQSTAVLSVHCSLEAGMPQSELSSPLKTAVLNTTHTCPTSWKASAPFAPLAAPHLLSLPSFLPNLQVTPRVEARVPAFLSYRR